jgi:hypothetical protein
LIETFTTSLVPYIWPVPATTQVPEYHPAATSEKSVDKESVLYSHPKQIIEMINAMVRICLCFTEFEK